MTHPNEPYGSNPAQPGQVPTEPGQVPTLPPGYPSVQPYPSYPSYPVQGPGHDQPQYQAHIPPQTAVRRPGGVTAAAVLAFIQAGLVLISSIPVMASGTFLIDFDRHVISAAANGAWLTVLGLAGTVVGGLLIAGGARVFAKTTGLILLATAASAATSVLWVIYFMVVSGAPFGLAFPWPLTMTVLPIIVASLVLTKEVQRWARTQ